MFSIGEFSRITGLTIKTLRFYHEKGILIPACVEDQSGYRYYDPRQIEKARLITRLRDMEFSLEQINDLLASYDDEADIVDFLERQKGILEAQMRRHRTIVDSLNQILRTEREARMVLQNSTFQVEQKHLDPMLVAGIRMKGRYSECGKSFATISRALGRYISGKCFLLHYDTEYREEDADFEACMPIRQRKAVEGISIRELQGGRCVSLLHKGPYEELGRSYAKILTHIKEKGYEIALPTREVYVKGPGMIFKGNPKNYLTEIQMLIQE
ncbi:MAG TPA: MerR family transcriptional regulator [Gemmataceae bacterium]|nr:MerR family transcriptional regulator [Gemmataceae bacterium]